MAIIIIKETQLVIDDIKKTCKTLIVINYLSDPLYC